MKRYIRSSRNDFTNKMSQLVSRAYSDKTIAKKAATGSHNGESMMQIFKNIVHDPNVTYSEPDKNGNQTMFYKNKNIGWINFQRGMGEIDPDIYDIMDKYVEPEYTEPTYEDYDVDYEEDYEEDYDDEEDHGLYE